MTSSRQNGAAAEVGSLERNTRRYEIWLLALFGLSIGIMEIDMMSLNALIPFVEPSLKLTNTQVGELISGYWVTFTISCSLAGVLSGKLGVRRAFASTLAALALCSSLSALANSFFELLAARMVSGLLMGPLYPLALSTIALQSPGGRRGTDMGIMRFTSHTIGTFIAPLLLAYVAGLFGWRAGFLVVLAPGLVFAFLIMRFLEEPPVQNTVPTQGHTKPPRSAVLREVLRTRNFWVCTLGACFVYATISIGQGFIPLYYVKIRHFTAERAATVLSIMGIANLTFGVVVMAISDRIGRKPVVIAASLLAVLGPLVALYYTGPFAALAVLLYLAYGATGMATLITATIPSESVPARSVTTAIGLVMAIGTVGGGIASPAVAGWSADRWGNAAPLFMQLAGFLIIALIATGLRGTARTSAPAPASRGG